MKALFVSFPASDFARSRRFYEDVLDLAVLKVHDGAPHRYVNYDLGGIYLKLYEWTDAWFGKGHSGLFIETPEIDDAVTRVRAFGCKATDIAVLDWGGRCCSVTDPFGNIFDLIDSAQKGDT